MSGIKKALALIVTCAMLVATAPVAGASSIADVAGTWMGVNVYYTMTVTFYDDYTYETIIDQDGQQYQVFGSYSMDAGYIYFLPDGGQLSALNYYFEDDTLTLYEPLTGETIYLDRQWDEDIPEELLGIWTGLDNGRTVFFTLTKDGGIVIAFDQPNAVDSVGTYAAADGYLDMEFSDDTYLYLQYMLVGDTLFLADEQGQMITLTRYREPAPTPAPVPTQPPRLTLPPAPLPTAAPTAPDANTQLAGTWRGTDDVGARQLVLTAEGRITFSYEGDAASAKIGSYVADGSTLTATYVDGTEEIFRYMLAGGTLLLMDSELGNPLTMTRQAEPFPTEPAASTKPALSADPALLGTWGGFDDDIYIEITFAQAGKIVTFVPSDPESDEVGSYILSPGKFVVEIGGDIEEMGYTIQGDALTLSIGDDFRTFVKKPGPLSRLTLPAQAVTAAVDAALVGTWGGMEGDVYREITFYGDGTYETFVPQDESGNEKGTCMAMSGSLAALLPTGAIQGSYVIADGILTLTWTKEESLTLERMPGPLTRSAQTAN